MAEASLRPAARLDGEGTKDALDVWGSGQVEDVAARLPVVPEQGRPGSVCRLERESRQPGHGLGATRLLPSSDVADVLV
jgi:hypothetical protein